MIWRNESHIGPTANAEANKVLAAIDRETGVYVGAPRKMSGNMKMAKERFEGRFSNSRINLTIDAVVVMMPQDNGIGTIDNVKYPGDIRLCGLPDLLQMLETYPPFSLESDDAVLATAILRQLLKDESGSAFIIDPATGRSMNTAKPSIPAKDARADKRQHPYIEKRHERRPIELPFLRRLRPSDRRVLRRGQSKRSRS